MFEKEKLPSYIDDALATWHGSLTDPTNACMKFSGENGELVDYVAKIMFKPNFIVDMDKMVAEAGDAWYYFRILLKIFNFNLDDAELPNDMYNISPNQDIDSEKLNCLIDMSTDAVFVFSSLRKDNTPIHTTYIKGSMCLWLISFLRWLYLNDIDFDYMHQYNVTKLSGPSNHGWKA